MLNIIRKRLKLSERELAAKAAVARETVRACEDDPTRVRFEQLQAVCAALGYRAFIVISPLDQSDNEHSISGTSWAICRDGFDSWKIHLMNFVDQFRSNPDAALILMGPVEALDERLKALMASVVCHLCHQMNLSCPPWAQAEQFLEKPWFVSGMESLKASSMIESPVFFRKNNIFVHENFLVRA